MFFLHMANEEMNEDVHELRTGNDDHYMRGELLIKRISVMGTQKMNLFSKEKVVLRGF